MRGAGFVVLNHVLQLKYYLNLELCPLIRMGRFGWPKYTLKIRSTSDLITVNSDFLETGTSTTQLLHIYTHT